MHDIYLIIKPNDVYQFLVFNMFHFIIWNKIEKVDIEMIIKETFFTT